MQRLKRQSKHPEELQILSLVVDKKHSTRTVHLQTPICACKVNSEVGKNFEYITSILGSVLKLTLTPRCEQILINRIVH